MNEHEKHQYGVIILAAGQSRRFQENKFLVHINGIPLLQRTLDPFLELASRIKTVIVVTGAYTEELKPLLQKLKAKQVHNQVYTTGGMSSSVRKGLACLQDELEELNGVFIHPGDIPFILSQDLLRMIVFLEEKIKLIIIPTYKKRRGHPLLVHSSLIGELNTIKERNQGLRGFLSKYSEEIGFIPLNNPGILQDIDYPEDLERIRA
ncbi:MAG: NTP transferase domain-containing protein [Candidatus Hodarchaeota archaeon]